MKASLIKLYFSKVLIPTRCTASSSAAYKDDFQEEGVDN
jgi:hypothetical protein